jgi:hypothetical protein
MRGNFGHVEPHSDGRMRLDCLIYQKYGSEIQEREPNPILRPFNKPKTVRSGQMGNLYCTVLANSPCCIPEVHRHKILELFGPVFRMKVCNESMMSRDVEGLREA